MSDKKVIIGNMRQREAREWKGPTAVNKRKTQRKHRRLHGSNALFAAAVLCVCGSAAAVALQNAGGTQAVMSHLTAGFEYDDTLGRLQFVSNVLPESAMVFLTSDTDEPDWAAPADGGVIHTWSQSEPWIEYETSGDVAACDAGEVMTVVKNREDEYTVRVMHEGGYESLYSGLTHVALAAGDIVQAGETIGTASGCAGFELRRDGLSILPVFGGDAM